MAFDWMLRWLSMLVLFALSTFAFSSYAKAAPLPIVSSAYQLCADGELQPQTSPENTQNADGEPI